MTVKRQTVYKNLDGKRYDIYMYILENGSVTKQELKDEFNLSIRMVTHYLTDLRRKGMIVPKDSLPDLRIKKYVVNRLL